MSSVIRKCFNAFCGYNLVRIIFSHWMHFLFYKFVLHHKATFIKEYSIVINRISYHVSYLETRFNEGQFSRNKPLFCLSRISFVCHFNALISNTESYAYVIKGKHHVVDDANILHSFCTKCVSKYKVWQCCSWLILNPTLWVIHCRISRYHLQF